MNRASNNKARWSTKLTKRARAFQKFSTYLTESFQYFPGDKKYNLSISHVQKFIWFRVAKVGTNSIQELFYNNDVLLNMESSTFCYYPVCKYQDYFKFAFVRNPWDRLVSCWQNKVVDSNYFGFTEKQRIQMQDFRNFVDYLEDVNVRDCDRHICLQSRLIDLNNIDYIGHFENFEHDLMAITKLLGLSDQNIMKKNASAHKHPYYEIYNDLTIKKVGDIYFNDINIFAYDFR